MPERRVCPAGHEYWWPGASWQHENCVVKPMANEPVVMANSVTNMANSVVNDAANTLTYRYRDKEARRVYQRDLMRRKRAKG